MIIGLVCVAFALELWLATSVNLLIGALLPLPGSMVNLAMDR